MKLTKYIGISNFNSEQIERLLSNCKIKPVNNQIEVHPYLNNKKLIEFCKMRDITITAYTPLGRPHGGYGSIINDSTIAKIAKEYNKTPAQIILKYLVNLFCIRNNIKRLILINFQVRLGTSVIPKSVNKNRIKENIDIFDFELKKEHADIIDKLDRNYRVSGLEDNRTHKYYPFNIEF